MGDGKALLDLRTFKSANYTLSVITMAIAMMSLFGAIILLPLYLVNVHHLDTLQTGLLLLPGLAGLDSPRRPIAAPAPRIAPSA